MGKELAIKQYVTYGSVLRESTIHPKRVTADFWWGLGRLAAWSGTVRP